jgi:hypothetical protein
LHYIGVTDKSKLAESRDTESATEGGRCLGRGADSPAAPGIPEKEANFVETVSAREASESARKRDRALREALDNTLETEFYQRPEAKTTSAGVVPKGHEPPAPASGAVDDQPTLDLTGYKNPGTASDRTVARTRKRSVNASDAEDDQATPALIGAARRDTKAERAVARTLEQPVTGSDAEGDQATLDMVGTSEPDNQYKVEAVRDAIAAEWALEKPNREKVDNAIDLALFFYRTAVKGDTRQTLGLTSIEGFRRDVRREVLDLLHPNDELTGVKRVLLIISTLGRDKEWKREWADDVTLALFVCENEGYTNKARAIGETLSMLIDRQKLAALRKMFS